MRRKAGVSMVVVAVLLWAGQAAAETGLRVSRLKLPVAVQMPQEMDPVLNSKKVQLVFLLTANIQSQEAVTLPASSQSIWVESGDIGLASQTMRMKLSPGQNLRLTLNFTGVWLIPRTNLELLIITGQEGRQGILYQGKTEIDFSGVIVRMASEPGRKATVPVLTLATPATLTPLATPPGTRRLAIGGVQTYTLIVPKESGNERWGNSWTHNRQREIQAVVVPRLFLAGFDPGEGLTIECQRQGSPPVSESYYLSEEAGTFKAYPVDGNSLCYPSLAMPSGITCKIFSGGDTLWAKFFLDGCGGGVYYWPGTPGVLF